MGLGEVQVKSRGFRWSRYQVIAEFWAGAPWLLHDEAALWCLMCGVGHTHDGVAPPLPAAVKRDLWVIYQRFSRGTVCT